MTSISGFLSRSVFGRGDLGDLGDLARLEGLDLREVKVRSSIEECQALIGPWTPLYVLPIGQAASFPIGLHLRPSDVRERRLAIISMMDEGSLVEIANSPRHLVALSLLQLEGFAQEVGGSSAFDAAVRACNDIFGPEFFTPGAHGSFGQEDAKAIAARTYGGTPSYYIEEALFAEDPHEERRLLKAGVAAEPGCMALQAKLTSRYVEDGESRLAARAAVAALSCYHHTTFHTDLANFYGRGRDLMTAMPDAFSDVARRDLLAEEEQARRSWMTELYQTGEVELAAKLLSDICHARADYDSSVPTFREYFERLGWGWARALCDLREG